MPAATRAAVTWPKTISKQRLAAALAWLKQQGRISADATLMRAAADATLMNLLCSTARQHAAQAHADRRRNYRRWAIDTKALAARNDD